MIQLIIGVALSYLLYRVYKKSRTPKSELEKKLADTVEDSQNIKLKKEIAKDLMLKATLTK